MNYGFVLRHGDTQKNIQGMPRGLSEVPLSRKGIAQTKYAAYQLKGQRVTSIRASRLKRTEQTATIVGQALGIHPQLTPKLDTINIGTLANLPEQQADKKVLEYIIATPDTPMPNGQSIHSWQRQVWPELMYFFLLITHGKHPLLVTHGRVSQLIDALIRGNCTHLDKGTFEQLYYRQKPGEVFIVTQDGESRFSFKKFV